MMDKIKKGDEVIFIKNYRGIVQAGESHIVDKVVEIKDKVKGIYIKLDFTWVYMSSDMFNEYCKKKVTTEKVSIPEVKLDKELAEAENEITNAFYKELDKEVKKYNNFCEKVKESVNLKTEYDYINPNHYKTGGKEVIDMMVDVWGKELVIAHCEMNAFKYRMRVGKKPNQPIEQDIKKAEWYENKAKELRNELS